MMMHYWYELNINQGKQVFSLFLNFKLFWRNNKTIIDSAFVAYEEFCRSQRVLSTLANTLLDLQNSSYPTQPRSIIAKYVPPWRLELLSSLLRDRV